MRILVTRPEPDATAQADVLQSRGHTPIVSPMLEIVLLPDALNANLQNCTALVVTSRNALRALKQVEIPVALFDRPVFCVGRRTAEMASELGFRNVQHGETDSQGVLPLIAAKMAPGAGKIARLTGDIPSNTPHELSSALRASGYQVIDVTCYRTTLHPEFTGEVSAALDHGDIDLVLLMSPLTAQSYVQAFTTAGLTIQSDKPRYVCISKSVADELVGFPQSCKLIADKPNHSGLLSVVDHVVAKLS